MPDPDETAKAGAPPEPEPDDAPGDGPEPDRGSLRAGLPSSNAVRGRGRATVTPPAERALVDEGPLSERPAVTPATAPDERAARPRPSDYRDEGARAQVEGLRVQLSAVTRAVVAFGVLILLVLVLAMVLMRARLKPPAVAA